MAQDLLRDRVKCDVPNPGAVAVGSTVTLGAARSGYRSWLTAFAPGGIPAYFILAQGDGKALTGVWTVNATNPETATITEILGNDRLGNTAGETFTGACVAWCEVPAVEFPIIRSGPLAGLRNLIINGNPIINQRGAASGAAVGAANTYTVDRWRVVTSGQAMSWADVAGIRTVTAPAGGVEQVIEAASIQAGPYTLSWVGTAAALVNGAAVANGGQVTLPGNTNATLRFSGGTFALAQLEPGPLKTPFEFRPAATELLLCQRYGAPVTHNIQVPAAASMAVPFYFPVYMRATPSLALALSTGTIINLSILSESANNPGGGFFQVSATTAGASCIGRTNFYSAEL